MNVLRTSLCSNLVRNSSFRLSRNFQSHFLAASFLIRPKQMQLVNLYSSTAVVEKQSKGGLLDKVFGRFANSKSRMRASSVLLYEAIADKISYYEFFEEFDLPDTFNSWFLVTELHCWLILTRVMGEGAESGQDGRFLRNCIVETLWSDVQTRAKKLSSENPSASRRQVQILSEQFQATLINYDEGLMSDDKILASALWRRFFDMNCNDYIKLEKLVKYVRQTSSMLDGLTRDELLSKPNIHWMSLKE